MHISEYVKQEKQELDEMQKLFEENNKENPVDWSVEMLEGEWADQELSYRFA